MPLWPELAAAFDEELEAIVAAHAFYVHTLDRLSAAWVDAARRTVPDQLPDGWSCEWPKDPSVADIDGFRPFVRLVHPQRPPMIVEAVMGSATGGQPGQLWVGSRISLQGGAAGPEPHEGWPAFLRSALGISADELRGPRQQPDLWFVATSSALQGDDDLHGHASQG